MTLRLCMLGFLVSLLLAAATVDAKVPEADAGEAEVAPVSAEDLVAGALDLVRGRTSYTELTMVIHRPDWERTSSLVAWTRGREDALIRFTAPARDAGNATLKQGDKMWTYTPKLNRTIRLPYSLMSQSWAGSDFSYNDLSRTDDLLRHYDLSIIDERDDDGHRIYTIEAIPHDDAPVVWGKEEWVLRDDYVLISQNFFDQSLEILKRLETLEIGELGGRVIPLRMRMSKLDEPENYTEVVYDSAEFDIPMEDRTFTVFSLQSGGR
jgi:outer membrane lipoprotein-sorting protein